MAELLVSATNLNNQKIGEIVDVKDDGHVWGTREQPPNYIHVTVTGATREQASEYLEGWQIKFLFTLVNQNAAGWRYRVEVDPAYISASNMGQAQMKSQMQEMVTSTEEWEGSSVQSFTSTSMTVDIPKNGVYQTGSGLTNQQYLALLKSMFADVFDNFLDPRRFKFADSDVATALAGDGTWTLTKAEAQAELIDKLTL